MTTYVSYQHGDEHFFPEEKHGIWTGVGEPHIMGGVLHAVATIAGTEDNPVMSETSFISQANTKDPITVTVKRVDHSRVYDVILTQRDRVITVSSVIGSDRPEPIGVPLPKVDVPEFRQEEWDWGFGQGESIWNYLKGWFRRGSAMMWLEGHETDLVTNAILADFGGINLVPLVGRFGLTQHLMTHWFTGQAFEKVYLTHTIEGRTRGHVITRLDQYDERGTPICATRMLARLQEVGEGIGEENHGHKRD